MTVFGQTKRGFSESWSMSTASRGFSEFQKRVQKKAIPDGKSLFGNGLRSCENCEKGVDKRLSALKLGVVREKSHKVSALMADFTTSPAVGLHS